MNLNKLILTLCIVGLSSATLASARCHSSCSSSCSPCTTTTTRTVRYVRPAPCFSFSWGFPSCFYDDDYEVVTYRKPCRKVYSSCCSPCVKRVRYVSCDDYDDDYCW